MSLTRIIAATVAVVTIAALTACSSLQRIEGGEAWAYQQILRSKAAEYCGISREAADAALNNVFDDYDGVAWSASLDSKTGKYKYSVYTRDYDAKPKDWTCNGNP
ncbi:MAG: hypothetical protein ABIJ34_08020 [archaeon]